MRTKKRWIIMVSVCLVILAACLGYWKRIGIRNTVYRMLDLQIPFKGEVYGYYGTKVRVKSSMEDLDSFQMEDGTDNGESSGISNEDSLVSTTYQIDQQITAEVESGAYSFEEPEVILDPYQISPLTGVIVFQTKEAYQVRVTVEGKTKEADVTGITAKTSSHRVPVIGLYPKTNNKVRLELLDDEGKTVQETELEMQTDGLPEEMDDMVSVVSTSGTSAYGLTVVSGQRTYYPYAYDVNGDIRWYLNRKTASYGVFELSDGKFIMEDNDGYVPSVTKSFSTILYEMDYLGRAEQMYFVPNGTHHEVIEKEAGGNLLILTGTLEEHVDDEVIEFDRETGELVNSLKMTELFGNSYTQDMIDWAHLNTVSYQAEEDTVLLSPRNLNSAVKVNWTTHEIVWILGDPKVWEGTKYEKYLLTPDEDFMWHYRQHTVYQIDEDLDGNPDTVEITMFDNHTPHDGDGKYYDDEPDSYVTVYAVNEAEKTVSLLKKLPVIRANVTSNTIYDAESGHIFGMCGTTKEDGIKRGMTYEFDYETGELINQYHINTTFYRAHEMHPDYTAMSLQMEKPERYIKGTLRTPVKINKTVEEPRQTLQNVVGFRRISDVLFTEMQNRQVLQIIFKGENATYVYDLSFLKLREEQYLQHMENIPIPLCGMEKGSYQIYCVYQDNYCDTSAVVYVD